MNIRPNRIKQTLAAGYTMIRDAAGLDVGFKRAIAEGRNPSPSFDARCYLAQNPDVAAAGINALVHFHRSIADEAHAVAVLLAGGSQEIWEVALFVEAFG